MKRRAKTSKKGGGARGRKTAALNRRPTSAAPRSGQSTAATLRVQLRDQASELRESRRQLSEALQREIATADVLKVISSSPGKLEPVFQALLANAIRVIGAKFGTMYLCEADAFRIVAMYGASPAYVEALMREPLVRPSPETAISRAARTKQAVQVADLKAEEAYRRR